MMNDFERGDNHVPFLNISKQKDDGDEMVVDGR